MNNKANTLIHHHYINNLDHAFVYAVQKLHTDDLLDEIKAHQTGINHYWNRVEAGETLEQWEKSHMWEMVAGMLYMGSLIFRRMLEAGAEFKRGGWSEAGYKLTAEQQREIFGMYITKAAIIINQYGLHEQRIVAYGDDYDTVKIVSFNIENKVNKS